MYQIELYQIESNVSKRSNFITNTPSISPYGYFQLSENKGGLSHLQLKNFVHLV